MKEILTIDVNMDIKCPRCGKPGATQGGEGVCFNCAAEQAKDLATEYKKVYCKYDFTDAEKREIAAEMAQSVLNLQEAEDRLKEIKSDIKSQINSHQAKINRSATRLNNGYEMRNIKCAVEYDFKKGVVRYIREDNGKEVKSRAMSSDDRQGKLFELIDK